MRAPETEFEDLEALLRADRPEPDPQWARSLDAKVAAGFPGRRRRWSWLPSLGMPQAAAVAASALLALVVTAAALTAGGGDDEPASFDGAGGSQSAAEPAMGAPEAADSGAGARGTATGSADAGVPEQRAGRDELSRDAKGGLSATAVAPAPESRRGESQVRRFKEQSAQMLLAARPRDIDEVASGVARTATELGGYVSASSVSSRRSGNLELRIPTARLDRAIEQLSELAKVRDLTRSSVDITAQVVSARSRLRDARTERSSLLRQLALADTVNETASIRARLRIVSRQIEANKAELRQVKRRATYATVSVALDADGTVSAGSDDDGAWTPGDAARDAVRVLEVAVGVGLIALAIAVPAGLLILLGLLAGRVVTRRRRERALDLA